MFESLLSRFRETITMVLAHLELRVAPPEGDFAPQAPRQVAENRHRDGEDRVGMMRPSRVTVAVGARVAADQRIPGDPATWGKVGRNERCPCGSGKKYKHCHGRVV